MAAWAWHPIAVGIGALIGVEVLAWLRHGTSAILLAGAAVVSGCMALIGVGIAGTVALSIVAGVTGFDPVGLLDDSTSPAAANQRARDANNTGACLDPDSVDYDCAGGSGDGPRSTGLVRVVGTDVYDLDRDGDGGD